MRFCLDSWQMMSYATGTIRWSCLRVGKPPMPRLAPRWPGLAADRLRCGAQKLPERRGSWWPLVRPKPQREKEEEKRQQEQVQVQLEVERRYLEDQQADFQGSLLAAGVLAALGLGQWFVFPFQTECDARVFATGYAVLVLVAASIAAVAYVRCRRSLEFFESLEAYASLIADKKADKKKQ